MAVSQSLSVTEVAGSANVADNTSKVRILWTSTQTGQSWNGYTRTAYYWVSINGGAETKYSVSYTLPQYSTKTILDTTITVKHKDDGTGSVKVRTWMDTEISAGVVEKSQSITLATIARASVPTVSASSVAMGGSVTITTNRKSSSFTHDLTYSFGGSTGTIATGVGASYAWTVPDLVAKIPNATKGTCTVTCKTLNGTTVVGTKTVTLTLTVPGASTPTVSASSVAMGGSVTVNIDRKSGSFTHDITYSFGGSTGTIATGVGTSKAWTVPDLVTKIPNKASGTCTITCKTKNGTAEVGSKTVTLTLTLPAKSTPRASNVQMGKSVTIYTDRKSSGFTHTLSYKIGSKEETVIVEGVTASKAWTPSKNLAGYTGGKLKADCVITCKTYNGTLLVGTATTTIELTVPDATVPTVSKTSLVLGESITINMPREATSYVHDISYTLKADGSSTVDYEEKLTDPVGETYTLTPSLKTLASKIPSATKGTITVTCKTRVNNTADAEVVGTKTVSFTVTVPDNDTTKPTMTMSLTPEDGFNGLYIQGISKVKVYEIYGSEYSTIASAQITVNGSSGTGNEFNLPNAGTVTVTGKVTDARGYSRTVTQNITVQAYSKPRIIPYSGKSSIVCVRCNDKGSVDPGGVYLLIQMGRKYSKVVTDEQKNFCKLSYRWKKDTDTQYSASVDLLAKTATSDYVSKTLSGIVTSTTTAYDIELTATDDVGQTNTVVIRVPTAFAVLHSPPGGHGITFGGYHDPSKVDTFVCNFDAEFNGNVKGIAQEGTTDGWYWRKYADGVAECWRRIPQTKDITTAWETMYMAECEEVTFPFAFAEPPVVNTSAECGYSLILITWKGTGESGTTVSKPASLRVLRFGSLTGVNFTIAYHAIGRWK